MRRRFAAFTLVTLLESPRGPAGPSRAGDRGLENRVRIQTRYLYRARYRVKKRLEAPADYLLTR
jgi:hypothetical protein